jgi:hypothetical protein
VLLILVTFREIVLKGFQKLINGLGSIEKVLLSYWDVFRGGSVSVFLDQPVTQIVEFGIVCKQIRLWIIRVCVIACIIFAPLYLAFNSAYSTYTYTYGWTLSIGYFTGVSPAVVLSLALSAFLVVVFSNSFERFPINVNNFLLRMAVKSNKLHSMVKDTNLKRPLSATFSTFPWWIQRNLLILLIANVAVVLCVHIGYILCLASKMHVGLKQVVGIAVSIFKTMWSHVLYHAFRFAVKQKNLSLLDEELYSFFASFMTFLSIFNNIIALYIAEFLISPNCLLYIFVNSPRIVVNYVVPSCDVRIANGLPEVNCADSVSSESTSYDPPFFYSFQCSSSLLTDFGEILILRFILSGLFTPSISLVLKLCQEISKYLLGKSHWVLKYLDKVVPAVLRPYENSTEDISSLSLKNDIFGAETFTVNIMTDITIILTLGVMFPPLAIVGCIGILISTIFAQVSVGRIVHLSRSQPQLLDVVANINSSCSGVHAIANRGLQPLSYVLSLFWAFFLFDILGDAVGTNKALLLPVMMTMVPVLIFMSNRGLDALHNRHATQEFSRSVDQGISIELSKLDADKDSQNNPMHDQNLADQNT